MPDLSKLFAATYPAVMVERWSATTGWPCFRVYLALSADAEPTWDGVEHEEVTDAFEAARLLAAEHGDCPIIDMAGDPYG